MCKKTIIFAGLTLVVLLAGCTGSPAENTITLSGAFALYPLAISWQEAYAAVKPEVKIQVAAGGAGKGMTDVLGALIDIAMVSREINPAETAQGALPFPVAKDAVIPTLNSANPALAVLRKRGLTRDECASVWIRQTVKHWSELPGLAPTDAINVYTRADASGAGEVWAKFLGGKSQADLGGVQVSGDPGLAEAVIRDNNGVGYNNIGFAYDARTLRPVAGLEILKIDFNGNGRIDPGEDMYATRTDLTNAIREGKYPSPPARELYFVVKGRPSKTAVRDFLIWVLTDGQQFVEKNGYVTVNPEAIKKCLETLR
jgi:phosphate transport system substrate-binding protein